MPIWEYSSAPIRRGKIKELDKKIDKRLGVY